MHYSYYRPQRKLRESNVCTGACLFTGVGGEVRYLWSHAHSRGGVDISGPRSLMCVCGGGGVGGCISG